MTDTPCASCGALPDWHLLYRPEDWPIREANVYWRLLTRHSVHRPCARFARALSFAPLEQEAVERRRTGRPIPGSTEDGQHLRAKVRAMFGRPEPETPIERGDAWEGEP